MPQKDKDERVAKQLALSKVDSDFRKGIKLFEDGYIRPYTDNAVRAGWDAALTMRNIRIQYLEIARQRVINQMEKIDL